MGISPASAREGDAWLDAEFSQCFDQHLESVRRTAYLLSGDWHRAEDLTQAAFLKLYLAWPKLDQRQHLTNYLRQIVVRTFIAERRRHWWRRERLTDQPPDIPADAQESNEDKMVVWEALRSLPPKQRAVLVLRYVHDLGVQDAAATLGCSVGTVKSQTSKGLAALRQRLGADFRTYLPTSSEGR